MRDSLERFRKQPREIWCVKLADRIANLREPPAHRTQGKRRAYAEEGEMIRQALGEASALLDAQLRESIGRWKKACS